MFCGNCGKDVENGVEFCPNCGKSIKGDTFIVSPETQGSGYPLSNLTAKLFSGLFEIILWIILIAGFVGGGILGLEVYGIVGFLIGIIIGGIASFVVIVLTGGLVSLFIKLVNNSNEIVKKLN